MRSRHKIILDRFVARPAALILNAIAWPLGQVMRRSHDDSPSSVKVIAIAKLLGMGSILRATPLIRALKEKYPGALYLFITARKNEQLLTHIPGIDRVLYIDESAALSLIRDTLDLIASLWKFKVDLYFDLEVYSAFSAMLPALGCARNRYGFYAGSAVFKRGVHTHLIYFNDAKNISCIYIMMARACGIRNAVYKIEALNLGKEDFRQLQGPGGIDDGDFQEPYIVINPNASDLLLERRWPREYFAALIDKLSETWQGRIFILGSSDERGYVDGLWNMLSPRAQKITRNLAGVISLGGVMALIKSCSLMITNDSGLYHIAASFHVKVISLWGPVDPAHYADMSSDNAVVYYSGDIYCSPCLHKIDFPPCNGNNICMKAINPRLVYEKACLLAGIKESAGAAVLDELYASVFNPDVDITLRKPSAKS